MGPQAELYFAWKRTSTNPTTKRILKFTHAAVKGNDDKTVVDNLREILSLPLNESSAHPAALRNASPASNPSLQGLFNTSLTQEIRDGDY